MKTETAPGKGPGARGPRARRTTVVHVTTVHPVGDTRIFHKECKTLARAGYDVRLVACSDRDRTEDGVRLHALPVPRDRRQRILKWWWLALRKTLSLRPRPAIVHLHDPELLPLGTLLRVAGFRVIFDAHEDVHGQILSKHWIPRPWRWAIATTYRAIEVLTTLGMGIIEASMIEGRYREPKQSVRNLPVTAGMDMRPRSRAEFERPPELVYTGAVTEIRGAMEMLETAEHMTAGGVDFHMRIVGRCEPASLRPRMEEFIRDHDLGDRVTLTGGVPFPEALRQTRAGTIGLCLLAPVPNYQYALPVKILEYMVFGLPVVASDLACTARYVRQADAGILVRPADPRDAAEKLVALISDPVRMLACSRNGQRAIREGLCWEAEAELLLDFYERMLDLWPLVDTERNPRVGRNTMHRPRGARLSM